jgi:nicotinamide-nucleotide amidase
MSRSVPLLKELMLRTPRFTLAVAESMTCGRVQAAVGAISGASDFFLGGLTAYTLDAKVDLLGVTRAAARRVNCVSADVAIEMARGVCTRFCSEVGIATTGYAERSPEQDVSEPFAWWALAQRSGRRFVAVRCGRVECPGASRIDAQTIVAETVLAELVEYLREVRG